MGGIDARVDDRHDLAFALLSDLVGAHHQLSAEVGRILSSIARGGGAALGIDTRKVTDVAFAFEEGGAHTAHAANRLERPSRSAQRKAIQRIAILPLHLNRYTREQPGHSLIHRRHNRSTIRTITKLNNHSHNPSRIPITRTFQPLRNRTQPTLGPQRRIHITHRHRRSRGRG